MLLSFDGEPWYEQDGSSKYDEIIHDETFSRRPPQRHRGPSTLLEWSKTDLARRASE
jgi:hypothetical protein